MKFVASRRVVSSDSWYYSAVSNIQFIACDKEREWYTLFNSPSAAEATKTSRENDAAILHTTTDDNRPISATSHCTDCTTSTTAWLVCSIFALIREHLHLQSAAAAKTADST